MSITLRKARKYLARIPTLESTRVSDFLVTASTLLRSILIDLPQAILAITSLAFLDFASLYAVISLGRFLFSCIRTRLDDQGMAITAALLLTLPHVAIQIGLTALQSLGQSAASSWQRRVSRMGRAVVSGAFWCAIAMVVVDLGVRWL